VVARSKSRELSLSALFLICCVVFAPVFSSREAFQLSLSRASCSHDRSNDARSSIASHDHVAHVCRRENALRVIANARAKRSRGAEFRNRERAKKNFARRCLTNARSAFLIRNFGSEVRSEVRSRCDRGAFEARSMRRSASEMRSKPRSRASISVRSTTRGESGACAGSLRARCARKFRVI
jgi:hypothetical protein